MSNGMKHIAITMLGLVLLAMLVACEGPGSALENQFLGPPTATPDVEATVEARVEIAKASLVAPTTAPLPTYTPLPTPDPSSHYQGSGGYCYSHAYGYPSGG